MQTAWQLFFKQPLKVYNYLAEIGIGILFPSLYQEIEEKEKFIGVYEAAVGRKNAIIDRDVLGSTDDPFVINKIAENTSDQGVIKSLIYKEKIDDKNLFDRLVKKIDDLDFLFQMKEQYNDFRSRGFYEKIVDRIVILANNPDNHENILNRISEYDRTIAEAVANKAANIATLDSLMLKTGCHKFIDGAYSGTDSGLLAANKNLYNVVKEKGVKLLKENSITSEEIKKLKSPDSWRFIIESISMNENPIVLKSILDQFNNHKHSFLDFPSKIKYHNILMELVEKTDNSSALLFAAKEVQKGHAYADIYRSFVNKTNDPEVLRFVLNNTFNLEILELIEKKENIDSSIVQEISRRKDSFSFTFQRLLNQISRFL